MLLLVSEFIDLRGQLLCMWISKCYLSCSASTLCHFSIPLLISLYQPRLLPDLWPSLTESCLTPPRRLLSLCNPTVWPFTPFLRLPQPFPSFPYDPRRFPSVSLTSHQISLNLFPSLHVCTRPFCDLGDISAVTPVTSRRRGALPSDAQPRKVRGPINVWA